MTGLLVLVLIGAIGAVAQVIDGSLGMGFGVFSASMMIAVGLAPAVAVAVVNMAKVVTGLSSGLSHWKFGNVRWDWLLPLSVSGVVGGMVGAYLLTSVPPETSRPWVSALLFVMGGLIVWRSLRWRVPCAIQAMDGKCVDCPNQKRNWQWLATQAKNHATSKMSALGLVAGLTNGLSGAWGPVATSGMMLIEQGQPRYAVGTANLAEVFVATAVATTILFRQGLPQFPLGMVIALAIGGAVMAPAAAYICRKLPARVLTFMVGAGLIVLNFRVVLFFR